MIQRRCTLAPLFLTVALLAACSGGATSPTTMPTSAAMTATSSPWQISNLPACSPAPCASYNGLVMRVTAVDRNYHPVPYGFHMVRITVTFEDVRGEQQLGFDLGKRTDDGFALRDPLGTWHGSPGVPGVISGCNAPGWDATLAPGATYGPFTLCISVAGPVNGPLLLYWGSPTPDCDPTGGMATIPTTIDGSSTGVLLDYRSSLCHDVLVKI